MKFRKSYTHKIKVYTLEDRIVHVNRNKVSILPCLTQTTEKPIVGMTAVSTVLTVSKQRRVQLFKFHQTSHTLSFIRLGLE